MGYVPCYECWGSGMFILDPVSDYFPSRIPDPGSELSPSRFSDPGSASKNLSILTRRKHSKCVLSFRKYDHGFLSPIPDPGSGCLLSTHPRSRIPDPSSRIPHPWVKRHRILDPDSQHCLLFLGSKRLRMHQVLLHRHSRTLCSSVLL